MALSISSPDSMASSALPASLANQAQKIIAAGATAASATAGTTRYDGAAALDDITSTLANGAFAGQRKVLVMETITVAKTVVITPANFFNGTTITLSSPLDIVVLEWDATGTKWFVVGLVGSPVIA